MQAESTTRSETKTYGVLIRKHLEGFPPEGDRAVSSSLRKSFGSEAKTLWSRSRRGDAGRSGGDRPEESDAPKEFFNGPSGDASRRGRSRGRRCGSHTADRARPTPGNP